MLSKNALELSYERECSQWENKGKSKCWRSPAANVPLCLLSRSPFQVGNLSICSKAKGWLNINMSAKFWFLVVDIASHQESILLTISQLCASTLNVKRFLENGLINELINLILLGGDDNIKREAVFCLSKVSWFLMAFVSAPILIQTLHTAYTCIYHFFPSPPRPNKT